MYSHKQMAWAILFLMSWILSFTLLAVYLLGPIMGLLLFAGVVLLVALLFHGMTVTVKDNTIKWGFAFGWFGQTLPLSDVVSYQAVTNSWRHGIGLRISHEGFVYSAHGFKAVELVLQDDTKIRLGTNDQAGLIAALDKQKNSAQ
ncbi:hypothetical protein [Pseudoalteromonas sp.]|uniref:hypothetical protein n=1 Tax=Pseudoalteromonas sp. TaxID=53249 RepID=UPI003569D161